MAGVIWGANFVLVKLALEHMSPLYYLGLRFLVGAVLLAPFSVGRLAAARPAWSGSSDAGSECFSSSGSFCRRSGCSPFRPVSRASSPICTCSWCRSSLGLATGRWPSPLVWRGRDRGRRRFGGTLALRQLGFGVGEILTLVGDHLLGGAHPGGGHMSSRMSAIALVQLQLTVCAVLSLASAFIFEHPTLFPVGRRPARCSGRASWAAWSPTCSWPRATVHAAHPGRGAHEPRGGLRADRLHHLGLRHR